jgi:hypothetical protein
MAEIIQRQDPEEFPSKVTGNGVRLQSREDEQDTRSRTNRTATRKATRPRTAQGKKRSKLNALKHGLFSKAVLLEKESQTEYSSLLNGLLDDLQPEGKLESVLVENLAALLWRKRRLLQAENADVSENITFTEIDSMWKRSVEAWEGSRAAIASGGLLKYCNNPLAVREARELLEGFRAIVVRLGFKENCRLLKKLYGQDQDGETPYGFSLHYELFAGLIRLAEEKDDTSDNAELREGMVALIDAEIERLADLEKALETIEQGRARYKTSAAVIPGQQSSDRLVRYEAHLSREIDRVLNRLERLQRIRKGHPLPPQLDVNIT